MKDEQGAQGVMGMSGREEKLRPGPWQSSDSLHLIH